VRSMDKMDRKRIRRARCFRLPAPERHPSRAMGVNFHAWKL